MVESTTARGRLRVGLRDGLAPRPFDARDALELVDVAREQRLSGWLAVRARDDGWPAAALEQLRGDERVLVARGLQQLDCAGQLQQRLLAHGLRVLPMKGAAVAESLYDSLAERAMADIDLLALDSWTDTVRVLLEAGLVPGERADHASCFRDPSSGQTIELHHALVSCPGLFPFDAAGLWARSEHRAGQVPFVPSPEDLLVQLGLHAAFQHGLVLSLGQYLDFRRLLERRELDAARVLALARASRAQSALATSLHVANVLLGAPVPAGLEALRASVPRSVARWLARRCEDPLSFVAPHLPALARVRWGLTRGQRLLFLARTLRPATDHERVVARCLRLARHTWKAGTFSTTRSSGGLLPGRPVR